MLERAVKVEDVIEFFPAIVRLADQKSKLDKSKNDIANIVCAANPPVLENHSGHYAIAVERQIAAGSGELATGDVAPLGQARLREFERRKHEQISLLLKARLPGADSIHNAISKRQQRHSPASSQKVECVYQRVIHINKMTMRDAFHNRELQRTESAGLFHARVKRVT